MTNTGMVSVRKPDTDNYDYRVVQLENRLDVLLISDPECDKAACAMNVGIGSLHEPRDIPGLAHFLEHMLFLGTEKFPDEQEYNKYISLHAGSSNAFTSDLNTVFYFTVDPVWLEGALDRFSQFFICPLFTQSATDRELHAVESEFSKNLQLDVWRLMQLTRAHSNPSHPMNRFTIGSLDTLKHIPNSKGLNVRHSLLDFHKKFYSSNVSKLCILGKESLDDLEIFVKQYFSPIEDKDVQLGLSEYIGRGEIPFRQGLDLCCEVHVVPVRDLHSVEFQFMLGEQTRLWKSKPTLYPAHIIGHESKGSVLSLLKAEGLATELNAGPMWDHAGLCIFGIQIILTEKGVSEEGLQRCGEVLFACIRMMNEVPVKEWIFTEMQTLKEIEFRYKSSSDPASHVISQATNLHHYPYEDCLSGPALLYEYDPKLIEEVLGKLNLPNLRLVVSSKTYENICTETECFFGTKYRKARLRSVWCDRWEKCLNGEYLVVGCDSKKTRLEFIEKNIFVPERLSLKQLEKSVNYPYRLLHGLSIINSTVFFKQDSKYLLPRSYVNFRFTTAFTNSLKNLMICDLFTLCVQELINEYAYDAEVAGLSANVCCTHESAVGGVVDAIEIEIAGFSDKLPVLLDALTQTIAKPKLTEQIFEIAFTKLNRNLTIANKNKQAYEQALQYRAALLQTPYYLVQEKLDMLITLTYEDMLQTFGYDCSSESVFGGAIMEVLLMGNIVESEAIEIAVKTANTLKLDSQEKMETEAPFLTDLRRTNSPRFRYSTACSNEDDSNSCSLVHVDIGPIDHEMGAMLNITCDWLHVPFFEALRTKQQLGYIVESFSARILHGASMCFLVQSATHSATYTAARTLEFIECMLNNVENGATTIFERLEGKKDKPTLNEELFETLRKGVITQLEEQPKQLAEEACRYLKEISIRRYEFDRREKQVQFLKTLTYKTYCNFLIKNFSVNTPILLVEIESPRNQDQKKKQDEEEKGRKEEKNEAEPDIPVSWQNITTRFRDFNGNQATTGNSLPKPMCSQK